MNYLKQSVCLLFAVLIFGWLGSITTLAQPAKLTKEELVRESNTLFESGKPKDALDLVNQYPEFADEPDVLYVKSVALVDLKDFKNADLVFQHQFELFLKYAEESKGITIKLANGTSLSEDDKDLLSMIYSTVLINFAMADMVNALRNVAFDKAGFTANKRETKNLNGFEAFRKDYEKTALEAAEFFLKNKMLKESLSNFSKVIEINPKNANAYQGRAKIYRQQRKIKLATVDEAKAKRYAALQK